MAPGELSDVVIDAVRVAVADGEFSVPVPDRVTLKTTPAGDYATPLPLKLSEHAKRPAQEIAEVLAQRISHKGIRSAKPTGPGFLTITLDAPLITRIDETYGVIEVPKATWPTRPLTFDNPGFRVRFAYARASGVNRHATDLGIDQAQPQEEHHLDDPRERRLLARLAEFPVRAEQAHRRDDPRPFTRNLEGVADAYHDVHEHCPALPKGDEKLSERHRARLKLAEATRTVLGNGLRMLGETPQDRM